MVAFPCALCDVTGVKDRSVCQCAIGLFGNLHHLDVGEIFGRFHPTAHIEDSVSFEGKFDKSLILIAVSEFLKSQTVGSAGCFALIRTWLIASAADIDNSPSDAYPLPV